MKKTKILILTTTMLLVVMLGCADIVTSVNADVDSGNNISVYGSGKIIEIEKDYSQFINVEQHYSFRASVTKGNKFSVIIRIDDNLEDYLDVYQNGNTLVLGMEGGYNYKNITMEAEIIMPDLESLNLSGASFSDINDFNFIHDLFLGLSGASRVEGDINTGDIHFELSGASSIDLSGSGKNFFVHCSGASNLNLVNFSGKSADVHLSGASVATLNVSNSLKADLSGASVLYYLGNPNSTNFSTSGESRVVKL
ncbi:GIN domain-containing protein [Bacteroidota bacterium]